MIRSSLLLALALTSVACTMKSGNDAEEVEGETYTAETVAATKAVPVPAPAKTYACAPAAGPSRREQACWRWHCDGDAKRAATWNGNEATCRAGEVDTDASDRALRRINTHRFLADLPPVTLEEAWSPAAQDCALIAHANAKLSHTPPPEWACWSQRGSDTSLVSLVANRSAAPSIAAYFEDPANEATMVHRRWLLDEKLTTVGVGTTSKYSCVVVDGRKLEGPKPAKAVGGRGWAAWPPAGPVPFGVFEEEKLDRAGWTVQSEDDDLAHVTVTDDDVEVAVDVTTLAPGHGSVSAIRFVPRGWHTKPGHRYTVTAGAIRFTVEPILCDAN